MFLFFLNYMILLQYFDSLPGFNETELASVGGWRMFQDHCPVIFVS